VKQIKRKYRRIRGKFKQEMYTCFKENPALAVLAIETYTSWKNQCHIFEIWAMMRNKDFSNFKDAYVEKLMPTYITAQSDIFRSFYFSGYQNLYDYLEKIPGKFAMGDAVSVAYQVLRERNKHVR